MKLHTTHTVNVSLEEAIKLVSKYVEKKTGKKVNLLPKDDQNITLVFELVGEDSDLEEKAS